MERRRLARAFGGVLAAATLTLAVGAPAQAAEVRNHPFIKALVSGSEGAPPRAKLEAPCGVAVGAAGEIYASDYFRRQIFDVSSPTPTPVAFPPYFSDNGACAVAADPFNLYANYWHGGVVNVASGVIDPAPAYGIAVHPTNFDLYVNHGTSIAVYAAPVEPGDVPSLEIDPGPEGALEEGYGIAVSDFPATEGRVYVADAADHTIKVYDPAAPDPDVPVQVIDGTGTAAGRFVSLTDASLAIDQSNGHLFVVDNTQPGFEHPLAVIDEFNAEGIYRGQLDRTVVGGGPTGIAVDESETASNGRIYVTSGNGSNIVIPPSGGTPGAEVGALYAFGPSGEGQSLEVSISGAGQGSVKSSPAGISCPGACKAELNSGRIVTLTATAAPGSAFTGWSGACTGSGTCQVTLSGPTAVTAQFAPAFTPSAALAAPDAESALAASAAAPGPTASINSKPRRIRHRFVRGKTIGSRANRRNKEER
jgi:hypothetical protein